MCFSAYLYVRPLIRRRLGSVSSGYINWTTVYAVWLCAAVFYHLPSFNSMGLDVRSDLSMLLTVFLLSLLVLGALSALHETAVAFRLVAPRLVDANSGARHVFTLVILNAMTFAIACSTYYSFCGNAAASANAQSGLGGASAADILRASICSKWLHPVSAVRHPAFSAWVIYGEAAGNASSAAALVEAAMPPPLEAPAVLNVDIPLDGRGAVPLPAAEAISPVFTTWLTLFAMFIANCVADYAAAATTSAAYSPGQRRGLAALHRKSHRRSRSMRRRSAEFPANWARPGSIDGLSGVSSYASIFPSRPMSRATSLDAIVHAMSNMTSMWSPTALESISRRAASAFLFRDDHAVGSYGSEALPKGKGVPDTPQTPRSLLADPDAAAGVGLPVSPDAPSPSFLPMFPWYSGTSADLLKTLFDLMVSVKLFLGRFDMRTLEAATAGLTGNAAVAGSGGALPRDGDGYTFEHLAEKDEAWVDFCGDTGDGGDPTYSVARCLAAQQVAVEVPEEAMAQADAETPMAKGANVRVLPRAQTFIHGGDLAYPNPTGEASPRIALAFQTSVSYAAQIHNL